MAVVGLSVRWRLGLNDQAFLHLSRGTIRIEAEPERRVIAFARFLPHADDNARPVIAIYGGPLIDNPDEYYGNVADVVAWSTSQTHFLGFSYGRGPSAAGAYSVVAIPFCALVTGFMLPVFFLSWKRGQASRRKVRGLCPGCGYDLRATPERCPECGHPPAASA